MVEIKNTFDDIILDGNLNDWTENFRLDFLPATGLPGYALYGKYAGDAYVFAIASDTEVIGENTTLWLNTDGDRETGYQIFGYAGGVEYFVNFNSTIDGIVPVLYQVDSSGNIIDSGQVLEYSFNEDNQVVEFAIPSSFLNNSQEIEILADINNQSFLPNNYSIRPYSISAVNDLPSRTDFSKTIGIVFSETTAQHFFDYKAYTQLFLSMQYQAMQAGIPFDILTEDDLTDINNIVNYDALVFPSFRNVDSSKLEAIENTLIDAVYKYKIGIITAGDFLTNDENNNPLAGDSYIRMKQLLDITREGGGGPVNGVLEVASTGHPVMEEYAANEQIRAYNGIFFNNYGDGYADANNPIVLADLNVDGQNYNAVVATETGGRNVHFATEAFMGDNNLVWQALQWVVLDDKPEVRLNMSRDASIFISRNDMDLSSEYFAVNPDGDTPGVYDKMLPIVEQWKQDYNFVGSYYINIGNNPPEKYTDWSISAPYYQQLIDLGNEIGTHSYTHPYFTGELTPEQLEFEFNQSQLIIEEKLGIDVTGTAIPGNPEPVYVSQELKQYLSYVTGGYSGVGAGYPNAFGFMFPGHDFVYFAPNMSFDFSVIGFQNLTPEEASAKWAQEYAGITNHASQAIIHFPWHDYGPTVWEPGYTEEMFTNFIAQAYQHNTEFVTVEELSNRIKTFEQSQLFLDYEGNTITAQIIGNDVGAFGLNLEGTIASVNNWYAYDNDTVFLPGNGGKFTINLGAVQDDVTRIVYLPMRAELKSLNGDGTNLDFSFYGSGEVVIDLKAFGSDKVVTTGADSTTINGEILKMNFTHQALHTANIQIVPDSLPIVANPIADVNINEDASNTIIDLTNVFTDADDDVTVIVKTIKFNSNQSLINADIDGNQLILDYQDNQSGIAEITIQGTSNGKIVEDTFQVTVNPINDTPTTTGIKDVVNWYRTSNISPANTVIDLFAAFSDVEDTDNDLKYSIQNNSNPYLFSGINIDSTTGQLTLDYRWFAQGSADITVRATDTQGLYTEAEFTVTASPVDNVINGDSNANSLRGDKLRNLIRGYGGNDNIDGKDGNDLIYGGVGNDQIQGNKGEDLIFGEGGSDTIEGGSGDDTIHGNRGDDQIFGGSGNDVIYGDFPTETVFVSDFEAAPDDKSWFMAAPLDGWGSTDGYIEYRNDGAAKGNNYIELNEDPINYYQDARQIYRDIATEAGKSYKLTFQYAPRPGYSADVNAIEVRLDDTTMLSVSRDGTNNSSNEWQTYTVTFEGDGTNKHLEFISTGNPVDYGRGGFLDEIKLVAYDKVLGKDTIVGGRGSDIMTGGAGRDRFVFVHNDSLLTGEYDVITDFEVGVDKVEFQGWGSFDTVTWFNGAVSQGRFMNTTDGTLFKSNYGGQVLFADVELSQLSGQDFVAV